MAADGVAVFHGPRVIGEVIFHQRRNGVIIEASFTKMPSGKHGFHIHKAGDLRGHGCQLACDHWHKGAPTKHGGPPESEGPRHTGDLGNIELKEGQKEARYEYFLRNIKVDELYGRSIIVHADEDDLGEGDAEDSHTTGHSGARIACVLIGRSGKCDAKKAATRKNHNPTRK